jgi:hypothetical protein
LKQSQADDQLDLAQCGSQNAVTRWRFLEFSGPLKNLGANRDPLSAGQAIRVRCQDVDASGDHGR